MYGKTKISMFSTICATRWFKTHNIAEVQRVTGCMQGQIYILVLSLLKLIPTVFLCLYSTYKWKNIGQTLLVKYRIYSNNL